MKDVAGKPNTTAVHVATFTVNDGVNTGSATENVTVSAINQPPFVQVNDSSSLSYTVSSTAIAIMNMALISDPDSSNLTKLTIQITAGYQNSASGHGLLSFVNQLGITGSFNAATGPLTLSGTSSVSNYRTALRAVMFNTSGSAVNTSTRTFTVIATDDTSTSSIPVTRNVTAHS